MHGGVVYNARERRNLFNLAHVCVASREELRCQEPAIAERKRFLRQIIRQKFESDCAFKVKILSLVDDPHASGTEFLDDV